MYLSNESLLVILLVGLIAGWLAGKLVCGTGFGLIGNMAVGIVGALPRLGIRLGAGIITAIVNATIGAAILLFLMRFAQGQGWDKRWRWWAEGNPRARANTR